MTWTACQARGSDGSSGSDIGLLSQPPSPSLPAAATITASLIVAAYHSAAPSALWSVDDTAGRHEVTEMLITFAPIFAACTTARAKVFSVPALTFSSELGSAGPGLTGSKAREGGRIKVMGGVW